MYNIKRFLPVLITLAAVLVLSMALCVNAGAAVSYGTPLPSGAYPVPEITPPPSHPRLLMTRSDIETIKENMQASVNTNALTKHNQFLERNDSGNLGTGTSNNYNVTKNLGSGNINTAQVLAVYESWAFDYAINGNTANGYKAINSMIEYLNTTYPYTYQYATRAQGHIIYVAAEVYDWCYDLLTDEQKATIIAKCEEIAAGGPNKQYPMEIGYPPSGQGPVTTHGAESQLMRDLLSFGIAVYDERPDIYNYVAGRFFYEYVDMRNWWYQSHSHHQGDAYGYYRYLNDMCAYQIFYRMNGTKVYTDDVFQVPYEWIYTRRPDGMLFRRGDCWIEREATSSYNAWRDHYGADLMADLAADPYIRLDYKLANPNNNKYTWENNTITPVWLMLLTNTELQPAKSFDDLPKTRMFGSPGGEMIARTGWDVNESNPAATDDVVVHMKVGEWWGSNHDHLDAGTFQIYYKGILTGDTGVYDSYFTNHDSYYNKRTIAHNGLLLYKPGEGTGFWGDKKVNDGGQMAPYNGAEVMSGKGVDTFKIWKDNFKRATIDSFGFDRQASTPEYSYVVADLTPSYDTRADEVKRSMVFMPTDDADYPAIFIVADKMVSKDAGYKKTFLLHYYDTDPTVNGNTAVIKNTKNKSAGKLTNTTLLPENAVITNVGGSDSSKRFWVNGTNYAPSNLSTWEQRGVELGMGRLEISPSLNANTDYFLNVMSVSDALNTAEPLKTELIENSDVYGAKVYTDNASKVAVFCKDSAKEQESFSFTVPGTETNDVFVSGLKVGSWAVTVDGKQVGTYITTATDSSIYFTANSGSYIVTLESDTIKASVSEITIEPKKYSAGDKITVSASVLSKEPDANVIFALYNVDGTLNKVVRQNYDETRVYSQEFTAFENCTGAEVKVFVWEKGTVSPLCESKTATLYETIVFKPVNISNVKHLGSAVTSAENQVVNGGWGFMYGDMFDLNMYFNHCDGAKMKAMPAILENAKYFTTGKDFNTANVDSYIEFDVDVPVGVIGLWHGDPKGSNYADPMSGWTICTATQNSELYNKYKWLRANRDDYWTVILYKEFPAGKVVIPSMEGGYMWNVGGFAVESLAKLQYVAPQI